MQKAKKMSKQTLVIAVLAILLVLSLALSVTGAWFTDTTSAEKTTDIQFATVAIGDASLDSELQRISGSTTRTLVLPGDTVHLAGSVETGTTSTVDIYVAIYLSDVSFSATGVKGATKGTAVNDIDLKTIAGSDITVGDLTTNVTGTASVEDNAATYTGMIVYKIALADAATNLANVKFDYSGDVEFATSLKNNYENGGLTYVLNDNGQVAAGDNTVFITEVTISAEVKVAAIQVDNIDRVDAIDELAHLCEHPDYVAA